MSERGERDPVLDEWQQSLAAQLRATLAVEKVRQSELARAMGMKETMLSRRLLGKVSFSAEELLFLADWMDKNIAEIMAAAKARQTAVCRAHRAWAIAQRQLGRVWPYRGYELAEQPFWAA